MVDDGSSGDSLEASRKLSESFDARFRFIWRGVEAPTHGPAASRNLGIERARGRYVGFLDDDDLWRDPTHLARAAEALGAAPRTDLYLVNQCGVTASTEVVGSWLPSLDDAVSDRSPLLGPDVFEVTCADLMQPGGIGFAHVNMCLVRRALVRSVGGFWSGVPYEEDLNWYLRVADAAGHILYRQATVAVHSVQSGGSLSAIDAESRLLFRMLSCQHALISCRKPVVRRYAKSLLAGTLKTLARQGRAEGRFHMAADCAAQAAAIDPSTKWRAIALYLRVRALAMNRDPVLPDERSTP